MVLFDLNQLVVEHESMDTKAVHRKNLYTFFLFSNKMLVFRFDIQKMLIRISNREDLLKKQSGLGLCC